MCSGEYPASYQDTLHTRMSQPSSTHATPVNPQPIHLQLIYKWFAFAVGFTLCNILLVLSLSSRSTHDPSDSTFVMTPVLTRPRLVLFGDSLTERSYNPDGGWAAALSDYYCRKVPPPGAIFDQCTHEHRLERRCID
jgi:hypothetical protein